MKHIVTKYSVSVEVDLGTFSTPPSSEKKYLGDLNYWFRYNLGTWKRLSVDVINFMRHIEDAKNKEDLLKYLNK